MGSRGPVPKRSSQRRRVNKPEVPVERGPAGPPSPAGPVAGAFKVPPPAEDWHETARDWYAALRQSGQSRWYEASDWMEAFVAAEVLSRMLLAGRFSAQLFAAWSSHTCRLLVTEGDRRRVRIELERADREADPDVEAGVTAIDGWRKRFADEASA